MLAILSDTVYNKDVLNYEQIVNMHVFSKKRELSEYSDNYPLKTGPETIDFGWFLRDTVEMGTARLRALTRL